METRKDAYPKCPHCHGLGIVKGEKYSDTSTCVCVIARRKIKAANRRLEQQLPARCRTMTFDSFQTGGFDQNQRALKVARSFADHYPQAAAKGWVLGFHGCPRSGKTHLATAILRECTWRFGLEHPQLLNLPKALRAERDRYDNPEAPSLLQQAQTSELLILDDLGAEYHREADSSRVSWLSEQLYQLLDERLMRNLPLIYTTNLSPSDIARRFDNEEWRRVYSRLESAQVMEPLEILSVEGATTSDPLARDLLFAPRPADDQA